MRIPIPERFTARQTLSAGLSLLTVQLLEGTEPQFALLTLAYVILVAVAYNGAGGMFYPSGAWILFTGVETTLIGLCYKALLGQPAQSHLQQPDKTMLIYCVGMAGMGLAAWLSRLLRPRRGLLANLSVGERLKESAVGCLVLGVVINYFTNKAQAESASLLSALAQLNHFVQLAILLATMYEIQHSEGRRCTNWIVWAAGLYLFGFGLLTFSKEGMFAPIVTWLIPTIVLRFNFSRQQVAAGALAFGFTLYYLVPYSQVGRIARDPENIYNNFDPAWDYLTHLSTTRAAYLQSSDVVDISDLPHLYDESGGLFDRIQMLAFDDALITITDQGSVYGLAPAVGTFVNSIPRFLWRDKPEYHSGNVYGRQIGVIAENDEETGVSFSPTGDAYHEATWFGVIVVETFIMFVLFLVTDSLSGDVRQAPWGLLFLALFVHAAPEGELPAPIWLATFGAEGVVLAAWFSGYAIPWMTRLLSLTRPIVNPVAFVSRHPPPLQADAKS